MKSPLLRSVPYFIMLVLASCGQTKEKSEPDLFDTALIHEVMLDFPQDNFKDSLRYFKALKDSAERVIYLGADLTLDGVLFTGCGIRYKGESSYSFANTDKLPLKVKLDKYNKGQNHQGVSQFSLRNMFKDPSALRDILYADFLRKLGLPAPGCAYAKVYYNGRYHGLYLITEEIDGAFLKANYHTKKGILYRGEPDARLKWYGPDTSSYNRKYRIDRGRWTWQPLINTIERLNSKDTGSVYYEQLKQVVDLDEMFRYWATANLLANVDAYNMFYPHNYYLYYHPDDSLMHWIAEDFNYSFAAWNPEYDLGDMVSLDIEFIQAPDSLHPACRHLLENATECRKRYLKIYSDVLDAADPDWFEEEAEKYTALIKDALKDDPNKLYPYEDFVKNAHEAIGDTTDPGAYYPGVITFIKRRYNYVNNLLEQRSDQLDM